jgi:hypothetical protein
MRCHVWKVIESCHKCTYKGKTPTQSKSSHLDVDMQSTQKFVAMGGEQQGQARRTRRRISAARYVVIFLPLKNHRGTYQSYDMTLPALIQKPLCWPANGWI